VARPMPRPAPVIATTARARSIFVAMVPRPYGTRRPDGLPRSALPCANSAARGVYA
jgi:hypothetical protein